MERFAPPPPPSTHRLQIRCFCPLMLQSRPLGNPILRENPQTNQTALVKDSLRESRRLHLVGEGEGQTAGEEQ